MRRSDQFSTPMRQSYVAILLIIYNTYRVIVRQLWPFILLYLIGGSENRRQWLIYLVAGMAILGMVISIIKFFRFYFYLEDDELVVESGVLSKKRLTVPLERIQTINFEQTIIHRMFNVVKLKVDTAGTDKQEFNLEALDYKTAETLRDILITRKKEATSSELAGDDITTEQENTILQLSPLELLRAGIVENHLKSGWILFAGIFWLWQNLEDAGLGGRVEERMETVTSSIMITLFFALAFVVISFSISLVRMILFNYDLKFLRTKDGFKVNAGLLTKKTTAALDNKIQVISWSDNLLKKLFKLKDLYLRQASSREVRNNKSIKIPGTQEKHIQQVVDALYPYAGKIGSFHRVHPSYFRRIALYLGLVLLAGVAFFAYTGSIMSLVIFSCFFVYLIFVRYLRYRKMSYGFNDQLIRINGGAYGEKSTLMPIFKIQAMEKSTTPYQRRKGLASLHIHTATGSSSIPYIPVEKANAIMDYFLFKTEISRASWM